MRTHRNSLAKAVHNATEALSEAEAENEIDFDFGMQKKERNAAFFNLCEEMRDKDIKIQRLISAARTIMLSYVDSTKHKLEDACRAIEREYEDTAEIDPEEGTKGPYR